MRRVLFVDDEPNVLEGLQRMLRSMRGEWQMRFCTGAREALAVMQAEPFDVVVSDIRMPGMNGIDFLATVAREHPGTVRIALSGHAELEMILESTRAAHQYLAKPCEADTLKATVDRALALKTLLADPELDQLVTELDSLPSLPTLYAELMDELAKPDTSMVRVGEIIGRDVAMTAKILQLVNSAFFGLARSVSTPTRAATILGMDVVRSLVLTVKVFSEFDVSASGFRMEALWHHSFETGTLARKIAAAEGEAGKVCDAALMAGMLHDVGKLVLASRLPERYREVCDLCQGEGLDDVDAEHRVFGCTHTEVGAYLLGIWGLPNAIVEAVAYHHRPSGAVGEVFTPLTAVHAANALLEEAEGGEGVASRLDLDYLERLGLSERVAVWRALCAGVRAQGSETHV